MQRTYLPAETLRARLSDKSIPEPNSGCWLWLGSDVPTGYGQMWNGFRPEQAHRLAYRAEHGAVPAGLEIDHKCRTPQCVNPAHLEAVPHKENMRRSHTVMGVNSRKTECKRGHPLESSNLYINPKGHRQCRKCVAMHSRRYRKTRMKGLTNG